MNSYESTIQDEIIFCLKQYGIFDGNCDHLSSQDQYFLAQDILSLYRRNEVYLAPIGYTDFIVGGTYVLAGLILIRYPPPIRTVGITLIMHGLAMVGDDYVKDFIQYLMDKGFIEDRDQRKLREMYEQSRTR